MKLAFIILIIILIGLLLLKTRFENLISTDDLSYCVGSKLSEGRCRQVFANYPEDLKLAVVDYCKGRNLAYQPCLDAVNVFPQELSQAFVAHCQGSTLANDVYNICRRGVEIFPNELKPAVVNYCKTGGTVLDTNICNTAIYPYSQEPEFKSAVLNYCQQDINKTICSAALQTYPELLKNNTINYCKSSTLALETQTCLEAARTYPNDLKETLLNYCTVDKIKTNICYTAAYTFPNDFKNVLTSFCNTSNGNNNNMDTNICYITVQNFPQDVKNSFLNYCKIDASNVTLNLSTNQYYNRYETAACNRGYPLYLEDYKKQVNIYCLDQDFSTNSFCQQRCSQEEWTKDLPVDCTSAVNASCQDDGFKSRFCIDACFSITTPKYDCKSNIEKYCIDKNLTTDFCKNVCFTSTLNPQIDCTAALQKFCVANEENSALCACYLPDKTYERDYLTFSSRDKGDYIIKQSKIPTCTFTSCKNSKYKPKQLPDCDENADCIENLFMIDNKVVFGSGLNSARKKQCAEFLNVCTDNDNPCDSTLTCFRGECLTTAQITKANSIYLSQNYYPTKKQLQDLDKKSTSNNYLLIAIIIGSVIFVLAGIALFFIIVKKK